MAAIDDRDRVADGARAAVEEVRSALDEVRQRGSIEALGAAEHALAGAVTKRVCLEIGEVLRRHVAARAAEARELSPRGVEEGLALTRRGARAFFEPALGVDVGSRQKADARHVRGQR